MVRFYLERWVKRRLVFPASRSSRGRRGRMASRPHEEGQYAPHLQSHTGDRWPGAIFRTRAELGGPPKPDGDAGANTAGGTFALYDNPLNAPTYNTGFGYAALVLNTTGLYNTATGGYALFSNNGNLNTAFGALALVDNTTGIGNTATGGFSLGLNTTGDYNTANGVHALYSNGGAYNTASDYFALASNTTGGANTANGYFALSNNTTGIDNTASGFLALSSNTTADNNTASGYHALFDNTTGHDNTANGYAALEANTTGSSNTASGSGALESNMTGNGNTAFGAVTGGLNSSGTFDTYIGFGASANGDYTNGTALGNGATLIQSNMIQLGNPSIGLLRSQVGLTVVSDRRLKKDIKALDAGPEHGLALIRRQNDKDRTLSVSYEELTAPIVKAIQEQQQEIIAERRQNADLRQQIIDLRHALEDQAAAFSAQTAALRHAIQAVGGQVSAAR